MEYAKQVKTRPAGDTQDIMNGKFGIPLGWFATKVNNCGGWAIHKPDKDDILWFNTQKESLVNVYRTVSGNGHTNLVKMSKNHGTVYFFDDDFYINTDLIAFETKGVKVDRLFFDKD